MKSTIGTTSKSVSETPELLIKFFALLGTDDSIFNIFIKKCGQFVFSVVPGSTTYIAKYTNLHVPIEIALP